MQETDFPFELIIGEDGSTDGTREICIDYANRYPDKIRLFLRDRSLSQYIDKSGHTIRFNGHFSRAESYGKYVALCEGDDYWIDKKKLSLQASILEANQNAMLCCSSYVICDKNTTIISKKHKITKVISLKDALVGNRIKTCTVLYRNIIKFEDIPLPLLDLWFFDYLLWILLLEKGNGLQISNFESAYRIISTGATNSTTSDIKLNDAKKFYSFLIKQLPTSFHKYCYQGMNEVYLSTACDLIKTNPKEAKGMLKHCSLGKLTVRSFIKLTILYIILGIRNIW
jgi:glycosyltransferase involved in cell wall biosynthesis